MSWKTENWWVSHHNFDKDVRSKWTLPPKVQIHDCTLRDGEQMAGLVFSKEEKIKTAMMMDEIGIHRIEVGMPVVSKDDVEAMRFLSKQGLKSKIMCLARSLRSDVDASADAGVWGIVMEVPSSYHLQEVLGWTPDDAIKKVVDACQYAKDRGLHVTVFPWDSTRADFNYYLKIAKAAVVDGHADAIAFVDTLGVTLPDAIEHLVRRVKQTLKCIVEIHCHDDFGMGVANALHGVQGGADVVNSSFNQLGERCGNTATEEVTFALQVLYGYDLGLKFEKFRDLARLLEGVSGIKIPPQKSVIGDNVQATEAGIVVDLLVKARQKGSSELILFPYRSQIVGNTGVKVMLGKKSGRGSVEWKLKELGLSAPPEKTDRILTRIKELGIKNKRAVTDQEFKEIVQEEAKNV